MFTIALLTGFFSYTLFFIGLSGLLYKSVVNLLCIVFLTILCLILWQRKNRAKRISSLFFSKLSVVIFIVLAVQIIVNLVGALGPELAFDALWYHLTLPKMYLLHHSVFYIPGNLLYYSEFPKLGEMLYVAGISFYSEIAAKIIHFSFGILTLVVIYKISSHFFSKKIALLSCLVFYSNLVVSWESITAYIDLTRTFFESLAVFSFLLWSQKNQFRFLLASSALIGLAISTKILAFGSIGIFVIMILFYGVHAKHTVLTVVKHACFFIFTSLFIAVPWFIVAFWHTGNPFYPFGSMSFPSFFSWTFFSPLHFFPDSWSFFTHSPDPISIVYVAFLPLILLFVKKGKLEAKLLFIYFIASIFLIAPLLPSDKPRYFLPYLPALSVLTTWSVYSLKNKYLRRISILYILLIASITIAYRGIANAKYIPVIFNYESTSTFLAKNLNFSFGDFYDTDGYFSKHVAKTEKVLLLGFHNLYYVNFPFDDQTWYKNKSQYTYIATQHVETLPAKFAGYSLIHTNNLTDVKLYEKNK